MVSILSFLAVDFFIWFLLFYVFFCFSVLFILINFYNILGRLPVLSILIGFVIVQSLAPGTNSQVPADASGK